MRLPINAVQQDGGTRVVSGAIKGGIDEHQYTLMRRGESMTTEEWRAHTDDWRRGWRDCQEAKDVEPNPSEEYISGYRYAFEHPFGPVAVPM